MAKSYLNHAKYIIHQEFEVKGVIDKHDIIGAIFGQSEGITGEELDIRELQSSGKIGRIEIETNSSNGITKGNLTIPSGADMVETAILASTIEIVDKVGPCDASFKTIKIEDTRALKRKKIIERAKSLLTKIVAEEIPDSQEIANEVREEIRTAAIIEFGPDKLPAGPGIKDSEEIIIVEGRADVINLLKYNIKTAVAMDGSKIQKTLADLARQRTSTAFIDGDRGGELNLKKLMQMSEIDFIARAPTGREVEELTKKEILACLNKKVPVVQTKAQNGNQPNGELDIGDKYWKPKKEELESVVQFKKPEIKEARPDFKPKYNSEPRKEYKRPEPRKPEIRSEPRIIKREPIVAKREEDRNLPKEITVDVKKEMEKLKNTLKARLYAKDGKQQKEVLVRDLIKTLKDSKQTHTLLFDGIITKRLVELAKSKGVGYIIGAKKGKMSPVKGIELIEYGN
jgi:DNA primase